MNLERSFCYTGLYCTLLRFLFRFISYHHHCSSFFFFFFFFNDTATTEIYTLSLHDALPIWTRDAPARWTAVGPRGGRLCVLDRKSTRLNSSHSSISYAVFCLKKKKKKKKNQHNILYEKTTNKTKIIID